MNCPNCNGNRLRETWHKTEYSFIYELDNGILTKLTEIADLCPGNGVSVVCCGCGEKLHSGSIRGYMRGLNNK